ncbi:hypothetical protein L1766_00160 [Thermovorax subterraneus]|nr:hypothetical protein [Thermovorax subterraneus]
MVLNIPSGEFKENATLTDLIGADRIFATLPLILSYRYEGALLPIELAHGIASLSMYPSAQFSKSFPKSRRAKVGNIPWKISRRPSFSRSIPINAIIEVLDPPGDENKNF